MRAESTAHRRGRRRWLAGIGGLVALRFARAGAQDSKAPITLIVPAPAGVSADRLGRIVADGLSAILEVPVQVDNLSGDGGVTGTNAIAASARDGTVLGLAISSAIVGGRLLSRAAKFSPIDDFQWLTVLGSFPNAMVVAANSPHSSIASWLDAARETPVPWVYASVGTGSAGHLAGAYLRLEQRARLVHRTVESNEERYALLAEGKIAALFEGIPNAVVQSRRLGHQIIAVTSGDARGRTAGRAVVRRALATIVRRLARLDRTQGIGQCRVCPACRRHRRPGHRTALCRRHARRGTDVHGTERPCCDRLCGIRIRARRQAHCHPER